MLQWYSYTYLHIWGWKSTKVLDNWKKNLETKSISMFSKIKLDFVNNFEMVQNFKNDY